MAWPTHSPPSRVSNWPSPPEPIVMQQPSQWGLLFDAAISTISLTEQGLDGKFLWSFGGGTALMLQIDHRESHDIDLFIDDPQILPLLNPLTQGYHIAAKPDDYDTDGTRMIKLIYDDIGEIDFICCGDVTDASSVPTEIRGVMVQLETPAEIVGKKVFYRGPSLQPRDMFDIAAVSRARGEAYVIAALQECGRSPCQMALSAAERFDPDAAKSVISRLMHREAMRDLIPHSQAITIELLRSAVA